MLYELIKDIKIVVFIRLLATSFQGKNYWYALVPCILFSALSLFLHKGFPPYKEIEIFNIYKDNLNYLLIDTTAGAMCTIMVAPTIYAWWNLYQEYYWWVHIPVALFAILLIISGFLFSIPFLFVVTILSIIVFFIFLLTLIKR